MRGTGLTVATGHAHAILHGVEDALGAKHSRSLDYPDARHDGYKTVFSRYRGVVPKQQWSDGGFYINGEYVDTPAKMDKNQLRRGTARCTQAPRTGRGGGGK